MGRLFGTDGARGIANLELTCELAMQIGRAAAVVLTKETAHKPKIVIARDTRISSEMLVSRLPPDFVPWVRTPLYWVLFRHRPLPILFRIMVRTRA